MYRETYVHTHMRARTHTLVATHARGSPPCFNTVIRIKNDDL